MKAKKWTLYVVLFATVALLSCGTGQKKDGGKDAGSTRDELCGEGTGYAQIYDNDVSMARDRALDEAMNFLVKAKLGQVVSGTSVAEDFALVASIVEARSSGMVKDVKVLKEGPEQGAFVMTIKGCVYPQAVNDTIASTICNYGRPKFMVLIRERFEGKANEPGFTVTELTMMEIMGKAGFEFVDAAMTQQLMRQDRSAISKAMAGRIDPSVQHLLLDRKDIGAEVVIVGTAETKDQSHAMARVSKNMKSKSAIINVKAIDVYTGNILASTSANAPGLHIESETASKTAIQRCLQQILGKEDEDDDGKFKSGPFMNQITKKFLRAATEREINMTVTGLDNTAATKFRSELKGRIRGVKEANLKGQSGIQTKIQVIFAGKTDQLVQELQAKSRAIGFDITVNEQFPNKVMLGAKALK